MPRERLIFPDLKHRVVAEAERYAADAVLIEDTESGTSLIQELRREGPIRPIGIPPEGDKVIRMLAPSAKIEAGYVLPPERAPWLRDFQTEILQFPHGRQARRSGRQPVPFSQVAIAAAALRATNPVALTDRATGGLVAGGAHIGPPPLMAAETLLDVGPWELGARGPRTPIRGRRSFDWTSRANEACIAEHDLTSRLGPARPDRLTDGASGGWKRRRRFPSTSICSSPTIESLTRQVDPRTNWQEQDALVAGLD